VGRDIGVGRGGEGGRQGVGERERALESE